VGPQNGSMIMNKEQKNLIRSLFADNSIGIIGIQNTYGADEYRCPSCHASKKIGGHADQNAPIDLIEHNKDCRIIQLREML